MLYTRRCLFSVSQVLVFVIYAYIVRHGQRGESKMIWKQESVFDEQARFVRNGKEQENGFNKKRCNWYIEISKTLKSACQQNVRFCNHEILGECSKNWVICSPYANYFVCELGVVVWFVLRPWIRRIQPRFIYRRKLLRAQQQSRIRTIPSTQKAHTNEKNSVTGTV